MKKFVLPIIVALATGLSGLGCNKSSKLDTPSKFTAPSGPVEFKLKWPVGEQILQSLDLRQNSEITMPNQPGPIKQDLAMGQSYALSVLKDDPAGGHEVELEFLNMQMKMDVGGRTMVDYDSGEKPTGSGANPVGDLFKKIIGAKIQFFLDASNQVQRVEGINELKARLTAGGSADASTSFKNMFSEGYFKQMMDSYWNLPPKPVQPGDTWPVKREISMGELGAMELNYDITFQGWEQHGKRTCAHLAFVGTVKNRPAQDPAPNGMTIAIQDGATSGEFWFDPELGMFIESIFNQDVKMTITMPMNARAATSADRMVTMSNNMNQTVTIKLDSVK